MKGKFLILIGLLVLLYSCQSESPTAPEPPKPQANIVLDGDFTKSMTSYDRPQFSGYVKNTGNATGYNCMIEIKAYPNSDKITIIDTAKGFPADLGDIGPGQRAYFEAVFFNLTSLNQIVAYDYKITWLDR